MTSVWTFVYTKSKEQGDKSKGVHVEHFFGSCKTQLQHMIIAHLYPGNKNNNKKISTSADKLENITGTIYRASVTLVKWDVCSEPKDTKRQHPPSHSLFTLLLSDNRYRSVCCCTTRPQNSFIPQAERLLNSSSILHSVEYFCLFCDVG